MESGLEPYIYYIILGLCISYFYKAIKQIVTKDIDFYRQEIYTDKSVENWAVIDGIIKIGVSAVCGVYAVCCLLGNKNFWYVPICVAVDLVLYLIFYKKTLVKKDQPSNTK